MKIYISLTGIILCLTCTQCDKQLDLVPLGQLSGASFYQTEQEFEAGTFGIYSTLLNFYWNEQYVQIDLWPSDDVVPRGNSTEDLENFNWTPTTGGNSEHFWSQAYTGIARANALIEQLPEAARFADESNKPRFEGEAKFLRAYFYFLLAIHFERPPISLTVIEGSAENARLPLSEKGEVWDAIVSDLQFAQENLPSSFTSAADKGRVTSNTSSALLGKVYLYRAQWENNFTYYQNAITEFNKVIGKYSLVPFGDNFSAFTENNAESIFEVQFVFGSGDNTWLSTDFGADGDQNVGSGATTRSVHFRPGCWNSACAPGANDRGYGNVHATQGLQNEFEPGDPRKVETIFLDGDTYPHIGGTTSYDGDWSVTGSTPAKYVLHDDPSEPPGRPNASLNNERLIRYADVLLMLAEAKILSTSPDLAGAADLINQVRLRASAALAPVVPMSQDQMFSALRHERRVELAFEGHRYNDLVRWHRAGLIDIKTDIDFEGSIANANWSEKHLVRPIPQGQRDVNSKLDQLEEYLGD
jgi:starch-binding outer membrane protein, SusD/RagB family